MLRPAGEPGSRLGAGLAPIVLPMEQAPEAGSPATAVGLITAAAGMPAPVATPYAFVPFDSVASSLAPGAPIVAPEPAVAPAPMVAPDSLMPPDPATPDRPPNSAPAEPAEPEAPAGPLVDQPRRRRSDTAAGPRLQRVLADQANQPVASSLLHLDPILVALADSERHFRTLIEQAADGIVVVNAEGRVTLANSRA